MIFKIAKNQEGLPSRSSGRAEDGQGLLELIIAIGVLATGLFAVWALFLSNYNGEQEAKARVIGANLAREGIETVKNMRDSNWLRVDSNEGISWDHELNNDNSGNDGTAIVFGLLTSDYATLDYVPDDIDEDEAKLYINSDGFYDHGDTGADTLYSRLITIQDICCVDADVDLTCDDVSGDFIVRDVGSHCADFGNLKVGIDVQSQANWEVVGRQRSLTIRDKFFNWR